MQFVFPTPQEAEPGIRALKTVLESDGRLSIVERQLLEAGKRNILKQDFDLDALRPITPAPAAGRALAPTRRSLQDASPG